MPESGLDSPFMGLLIAAISEGGLWSEVAAAVGKRLPCQTVAFVTRDDRGYATVLGSAGVEKAWLEAGLRCLSIPDELDAPVPRPLLHPVDQMHLPRWSTTPPGPARGWWLSLRPTPAYILTGAPAADIDPAAIAEMLAPLAEPVGRALGAHLRIRQAESHSSELQGLVDRIFVGAIVATVDGRVIAANRSAERLMASHTELGCWGGLVTAHRLRDTRKLHNLIRECSNTAGHRALRLGTPPNALQVLVTGTRSENHRVLIFLMEARATPPVDASYLAAVYDLTPAEIRLIQALLQGHNLTEAARHLGLSRNTVHSQLKSTFVKTQTNRQGELIALLLRSPTVMYREPSGEFTPHDL